MRPNTFAAIVLVAVGGLADGVVAAPALVALAAPDRERHDDAVAHLELLDLGADLDDLAHELVADDVAVHHARHVAVVEVQVGAADGAGGDPDDGVARILDLGIGNLFAADVARLVPDKRLHGAATLVSTRRRPLRPGAAKSAHIRAREAARVPLHPFPSAPPIPAHAFAKRCRTIIERERQ